MWKELVGWFLFFVKWEGAVLQCKLTGRSELYASIAGLIVVIVGLCINLALVLGLFEVLRQGLRLVRVRLRKRGFLPRGLKRVKLNGKGRWKFTKGASIAAWLGERKLGITVRYIAIFILAATPVIPYLTLTAIIISKATKSRYGYFFIFIVVILKVLATVHVIYHW